MPTFPVTAPDCLKVIQGGARIYFAPYIAAGADGTFTNGYLGQVQAGGVNINLQREEFEIDGEEGRAPCDVFITKEQWVATFNLLEGDKDRTNLLTGADAANSPAFSAGSSSMGFGGIHAGGSNSGRPQVFQIAVESPNESVAYGDLFLGFWQIWRATIRFNGEISVGRDAPAVLPTEIRAFWDHSVTIAEGDKGAIGRKVTTDA